MMFIGRLIRLKGIHFNFNQHHLFSYSINQSPNDAKENALPHS